ncbi:MAG: hypothetical protein AB1779_09515 [Candidatus Thermoplasmatota archaeon]
MKKILIYSIELVFLIIILFFVYQYSLSEYKTPKPIFVSSPLILILLIFSVLFSITTISFRTLELYREKNIEIAKEYIRAASVHLAIILILLLIVFFVPKSEIAKKGIETKSENIVSGYNVYEFRTSDEFILTKVKCIDVSSTPPTNVFISNKENYIEGNFSSSMGEWDNVTKLTIPLKNYSYGEYVLILDNPNYPTKAKVDVVVEREFLGDIISNLIIFLSILLIIDIAWLSYILLSIYSWRKVL